jgi:hypothetical protein
VYFEQAAYGVPVRMALISLLLGLKNKPLHKFEGGFERQKYAIYDQPRTAGMHCANRNCIVHDPMEAQYVRNKFYIVRSDAPAECKLRCVYCESDVEQFVVASRKNKWFTSEPSLVLRSTDQHLKDLVVFATDQDAREAGFHSRRAAAEPRPLQASGGRSRAKM